MYVVYDNQKWYKKSDGYYMRFPCDGKRLHVYIWEKYNGKLPEGHAIHHKDNDKDNNDISNLECLTLSEHSYLHAKKNIQHSLENLKLAQEKAKEWHTSDKGRLWHKKHANTSNWHDKTDICTCSHCGKTLYRAKSSMSHYKSHFCSVECKNAYHKSSRLTNIPGKSFVKIAKIEECGYEDVYNMEVNQTHNFSIEGGLIVHNCRDAIRYGTEQFWNKSNQIQLSNRRLF